MQDFKIEIPDDIQPAEIITGDDGLVDLDSQQDLTPEQMLALAEQKLQENEKKQKAEDKPEDKPEGDQKKSKIDLNALIEKAKQTPDDITDEEYKVLVENEIIEASEEEKAQIINEKLAELNKKDPAKLTKEEKEFIEKNAKELTLVDELKNTFSEELGIQFEGDYSNDSEGTKKLVSDYAKAKIVTQLQEIANSKTPLGKLYKHFVEEGRGLETFLLQNTEPKFKSIALEQVSDLKTSEENSVIVKNQKEIVREYLESKSLDKNTIDDLLSTYEANNTLYTKADLYKKELEKEHNAKVAERLLQEKQAKEEEERQIEEEWNTVRNVLKQNDFNGFKIPQSDLKDFMSAILEPINENNVTRMDIIRSKKMTIQNRLLFDYMLFKDMKLPGLTGGTSKKVIKFADNSQQDQKRIRLKSNTGISNDDVNTIKSFIFK